MSYVKLIPSSILVGLAIVIGITLLLRNYDKITHKCGNILKIIFSIILATSSAISWVLAFMCYSFGFMNVSHALSVAHKAMDDLNTHILPTVSNLLHDNEHRILEAILDILYRQSKTLKQRIEVREVKYFGLFQEEIMMFHLPSTVLLQ
ncbi:MAG: hypothetical protein R3Y23_07070 [Bacillota bacterium]